MAFIQMNLMSEMLMRTVPVNVILPADKLYMPGVPRREDKPFKTLYLLHGVFGNYTDWVCGTRIQRYAEEHDLAVVMPSGDNAFYVDRPAGGNNYGRFVGEELVALTRKMFPLSHAREDTFIAGLSMGGYGSDFLSSKGFAEACFGDLTKLLGSDKDPKALVRSLREAGRPIPQIYMACGTEDGLLAANRDMAAYLKAQGASVTYVEGPGGHEWDFWDTYIKKAIEWLPTEGAGLGLNSGNVGL